MKKHNIKHWDVYANFKKKSIVLLNALIIGLVFTACLNDTVSDEESTETESSEIESLIIADDFLWKTTQSVVFAINAISNTPEMFSKISIYNGNPEDGGALIFNGSASEETLLENEILLPASYTELYLQCEYPSGSSSIAAASISNGLVEYTFSETTASTKSAAVLNAEVPESPECSGDDVTVTATSGSITIEEGKTYVVSGNFSGGVTFKNGGGTLRICGNVTLSWANFNGNLSTAVIEVTSTGSLTTSNLNLNKNNYELSNWGTVNYSGTFSPNGIFNNYGTANISGININSTGTLYNAGNLNISGNFNNNASSENAGNMQIAGHFNNNGNADFANSCQLIVSGNINQNNTLYNSGYISCTGTFTVNGSSTNEMEDGALLETANLTVNNNINGSGSGYSVLSVSGTTKINGSGSLTGSIDICDEDGIESENGSIASSVLFCETAIAESDCNPGFSSVADTDGDGVADDQDEYPEDSDVAYISYFPSETGIATIMFEDLWPATGDYDFNDFVTSVQGQYVSNAENMVTELILTFNVKAVGAALENGFGFQFDNISPAAITSVTGTVKTSGSTISYNSNGTEADQSKAVIIALENIEDVLHRAGGSMFNTVGNGMVGTSDKVTVTISFSDSPIDPNSISASSLNFFLIKNQERGSEIHMTDCVPTDLADTSIFGTSDDNSSPSAGKYYTTDRNLPWGLLVLEAVDYPIEETPITDAYSNFGDWAESSGSSYLNWYDNPSSSKVW